MSEKRAKIIEILKTLIIITEDPTDYILVSDLVYKINEKLDDNKILTTIKKLIIKKVVLEYLVTQMNLKHYIGNTKFIRNPVQKIYIGVCWPYEFRLKKNNEC